MPNLYPRTWRLPAISCVLFCLFFSAASSQYYTLTAFRNKKLAPTTNGFFESLPYDYATSNKSYPLLIVIHGAGDLGNGNNELDKVLELGISRRIHEGTLPISFKAGGTGASYSFVVVMPQFFTEVNGAQSINTIIDSCLKRYRILTNRIYVTGCSMGGGMVWNTAGLGSSSARRIAALLPMAPHNLYNAASAAVIGTEDVPVWAFHNDNDRQIPLSQTLQWINGINSFNPDPRAKLTSFSSTEHDAWTAATNPAYRENGMNIYEWMLTYTRNFDVLPVRLEYFNASTISQGSSVKVRLNWKTSFEQNNLSFDIERSGDGVSFDRIISLPAGDHPSGTGYEYIDPAAITGKAYYRLSQLNTDGVRTYLGICSVSVNTSTAKLMAYPIPAKEELTISSTSTYRGAVMLRIINIAGSVVQTQQINKQSEQLIQRIGLASVRAGYYLLEIKTGDSIERLPFVKN